MTTQRYASPQAVEAAIKTAARKAHAAERSLSVAERIRLEYFDRFLSRIFDPAADERWVLKGGTSLLARVSSARSTTDIDLLRTDSSLEDAVAELRSLAEAEFEDHFRFQYTGHSAALEGTQQDYVEGCRVEFDVYIGASRKESLHVDLVVGAVITDETDLRLPAHTLSLEKLPSGNGYRLYPVTDQIADKVCATLSLYRGKPSSREKDLVDLVLLATTQQIPGARLERALTREAAARGLDLPEQFAVPREWGPAYKKLAASVPACREHLDIRSAEDVVRRLIDPAVARSVTGALWNPTGLMWVDSPSH